MDFGQFGLEGASLISLCPRGAGCYDSTCIQFELTKNLGLRMENGEIDFEILQAVGSYSREIYMTGIPDCYDLQLYLHGLYGDRVPLTWENLEEGESLKIFTAPQKPYDKIIR